jgi:DNA-binding transcriptional LysR family regulator
LIEPVYHRGMLVQQLTYLAALAREQHFGRAAESCHVTQPTLSAGLRRLESDLGLRLVERGRRFEGLTPEGERMLAWAHRILADVDGLRRDLGAMTEGLAGRLRIGAIPTALPVVSLLTGPLRERHPGVDLAITSTTSRGIEEGLVRSELDVGLTYLDNEPLRDVRSLPLYRERYALLTGPGSPHTGATTLTWAQVADTPLCLLEPSMQHRRIVDGAFREAGAPPPTPLLETNSITALVAHVRDGIADAIVADTWLRLLDAGSGLRGIPLVAPDVRRTVGAVWLDRDPEPLLARAFVAVASEEGAATLDGRWGMTVA